MYKVGVIGDRESILGFSALGIDIFAYETAAEVNALLLNKEIVERYAILYITETAAAESMEAISKYRGSRTPAIILIPGKNGSLGLGMQDVRRSVEKAVGADILFK
jgi:V/A-type H+-transporting ATPase subunit F